MGVRHQLADELARYLRAEISASQLRARVTALSWGVALRGVQEDRRMAGSIELALAEFEAGHLSEEELKKDLQQLLLTSGALPEITTSASVVQVPALAWSAWADRRSVTGSSWQAALRD